MENFALIGLVENLRPLMTDLIVRRVIQHQPNGFIFQTRSVKLPALKISAEPQNPAMYPSEMRPPSETPSVDFLMVLRKHLTSAELVSFTKPLSERIVEFVFKTAVPTKELETMSLVVELLPNAPNIILLDAERRVLSSFLPITPQHGIGEYETYSYPKSGDKLDLQHLLEADVPELDDIGSQSSPKEWLISRVAGIGPVFAGEVLHRQRRSNRPVIEEIRALLEQARGSSRAAWLYTELPLGHILEQNDLRRLKKAILSPVELDSLERSHSSRLFANILDAAKFYYDEFETRTLLEQSKGPVLRDFRYVGRKFADREKRLLREQKKYEDAEGLQKTAQMLTSSGVKMEEHYESVKVMDYFAEKPQQIDVAVDSTMSLRENIDRMFKRYQKAGRGKEIVAKQIAETRSRRARVEEQMRRLQAIKDWDTWQAISSKLPPREQAGTHPVQETTDRPRRIRTLKVDDREILIGRSGRENDELTFQVAAPDDFWFHVAEYSGSHVVVRNPGKEKELNEAVLVKAAQLAAYFSQARNTSKVEVHYTKRKQVTKPRKAKPGLVRLLEFKSIKVEPKNWLNE
ncbi:MAG TPA: NFACT family protein [Terriglobia bacterium]|nr:NFACT family protein [Terriglobia bacterium]